MKCHICGLTVGLEDSQCLTAYGPAHFDYVYPLGKVEEDPGCIGPDDQQEEQKMGGSKDRINMDVPITSTCPQEKEGDDQMKYHFCDESCKDFETCIMKAWRGKFLSLCYQPKEKESIEDEQ